VGPLQISRLARRDLALIGRYTLDNWGEDQAVHYLKLIDDCCRLLCTQPLIGRPCGQIMPGLMRKEIGKHVIFYRVLDDRIFVWRVLHKSMLPGEQFFDDNR
jgi:toxin ParE1/3/4